jgi:hypothetical protein
MPGSRKKKDGRQLVSPIFKHIAPRHFSVNEQESLTHSLLASGTGLPSTIGGTTVSAVSGGRLVCHEVAC